MRALGVDPGLSGAAVLLDGSQVVWVASWRKMERQRKVRRILEKWSVYECHIWATPHTLYEMSTDDPTRALWDGDDCFPTFRDVIQTIEEHKPWPPDVVTLEGLRPHAKAHKGSLIKLGWSRGMLEHAFVPYGTPLYEPTSGVWRREQLGIGEHIGAKACEAEAVKQARQRYPGSWLEGTPLGHQGHVAEALWQARYGQGHAALDAAAARALKGAQVAQQACSAAPSFKGGA